MNPTNPNGALVPTAQDPGAASGQGAAAAPGAAPPPAAAAARSGSAAPKSPARKLNAPSEAQLAKERADKARAENLKKGREALAEKREAEPEKLTKPLSADALQAGARLFIRAVWMLSGLGARLFDGKLATLSEEEISDGVKEALPIVKRFGALCTLLSVLGFPLWLADVVRAKFERQPAAAKKPEPGSALRSVGTP